MNRLSVRAVARGKGDRMYFTGQPCKRGHISYRYTSTAKCSECQKQVLNHRYKENPQQLVKRGMWENARRRARKAKVPFEITVEDIFTVWPSNNLCPVFGTPLLRTSKGPKNSSPTLDRIRPELGYVRGNIAVLSMRANRIKASETDSEALRKVADWMDSAERND